MRLYDLPCSPWCQQVRIVLAEKGLAHERHIVLPGQEMENWFQTLNPLARTPVLVDQEMVVHEAPVISEYLEEVYPDHPLLPNNPRERASVRMLVSFAETYLGPTLEDYLEALDDAEDSEEDSEDSELSLADLEADCGMALELLDDLLDPEAPFAAGKSYSLADVALLPFLLGLVVECELEGQLKSLSTLSAYCRRLSSRPSSQVVERAWSEWKEMESNL